MLVFRKLEDAFHTVKEGLSTGVDEDTMALQIAKLKMLNRLIDYVNSMEWLNRVQIREKLTAFLQSKYNYQFVAELYNMKISTLQVTISYANKRLEQKIGSKTIDLILEGKIDLAEQEFLMGTGKYHPTTDLLLEGVTELLPSPEKDTGIDLNASERELSFLAYFTKRKIGELAHSLNQSRMKHLLYILSEKDTSYTQERLIITRFIKGEVDMKETLHLLKGDNVYATNQQNV